MSKLAKPNKKDGEKMTMMGFRVLPNDLVRAKKKAGLVALSKYLRALFLMWLNGEITVSDDDVRKYND